MVNRRIPTRRASEGYSLIAVGVLMTLAGASGWNEVASQASSRGSRQLPDSGRSQTNPSMREPLSSEAVQILC